MNRGNSALFIPVVLVLLTIISPSKAERDPITLQFGFHNMLSNYHDYYSIFKNSLENNITVHSVEFEWREDIIPGQYFWGRSDSIVIAAHNAMIETGVPIELRARFQTEICAPRWAPIPELIAAGDFDMIRLRDYEYYDEFIDYLCLFLERYEPGGVLASAMGWSNTWGITDFDLFGESDRAWYAIDDHGGHISPNSMYIDELAALYNEVRTELRAVNSQVSIPLSTLSTPFSERGYEEDVKGIATEGEYILYVQLLRSFTESTTGIGSMDEFDWHTFILYNDPLNPGVYRPTYPHWEWPDRSFHERAILIASLFDDTEVPISTFEGMSTCYWVEMVRSGVEPTHRNHIALQLPTLAEISVGGRTRVLTFDSTIDDGVSSSFFPEYCMFQQWWDDTFQPEDSLFLAYSRMATLLSGSYCTARIESSSSINNGVVRYEYLNPLTGDRTYMIRAILDQETDYEFPVNTSSVLVYRLLDEPVLYECPNGICTLTDVDWDVFWVRETSTRMEQTEFSTEFRLDCPNPGSIEFAFILPESDHSIEKLNIYDLSGRVVASIPIQQTDTGSARVIVSPILPSGSYFAVPEGMSNYVARFTVLR